MTARRRSTTGKRRKPARDAQRTVLVGDVHGCPDELDALLRTLAFDPRRDRLVFVGDLVARGPDSAGVVDRAIELRAEAVRGNHEVHVLRLRAALDDRKADPPRVASQHRGVLDTFEKRHWSYLKAMPLWLHLPAQGIVVVHGGMVPDHPVESQDPLHLVSLRSIRDDGSASKRIDEGRPWASLWTGPQHAVFGHDALRRLQYEAFATGLDTGCVYGDRLTALVIEPGQKLSGAWPARRLVSVRARKRYYEGGNGTRD